MKPELNRISIAEECDATMMIKEQMFTTKNEKFFITIKQTTKTK